MRFEALYNFNTESKLLSAMKALLPEMKMSADSMAPGTVSDQMVRMMMEGWKSKYGNQPDIGTYPME